MMWTWLRHSSGRACTGLLSQGWLTSRNLASQHAQHMSGHAPCARSWASSVRQAGVSSSKSTIFRMRKQFYTDYSGYTHFQQGSANTYGLSRVGQFAVGGLFLGGGLYYWNSIETIPYTGRRHAIIFVSKTREREMGQFVFMQQIEEAKASHALLPQHHPYVQAVRNVGSRIAAVATDNRVGGVTSHMQDMEWEYAVIKSPVPNAFVVPGGKVVVFSGLLDLLSSEDELAAVIAHETAHVLARHHAERMSTMNAFALLKFLTYALFGFGIPNAAMILGVFLPYSRLAEHEADEIGLLLMSRACYDPSAAPSMLAKLHSKERAIEGRAGGAVPQFLRTHPLTDERVERVKQQLPEAFKMYKESGCGVAVAGFARSAQGYFG